MSEFAEIPAPLFEALANNEADGNGAASEESEEMLSAKYMYYDDRASTRESSET
jgi:hypothetical protein